MIHPAANRLLSAQIENKSAIDLLRSYTGTELLIYADPPYLKETRTLNGDQYRYEMTDADHEALLNALSGCDSMVLLSGYDCDMYNDMLHDWEKATINTTAERGARRIECLWINPYAQESSAQQRMSF